jgi:signal transduction histidine kinase
MVRLRGLPSEDQRAALRLVATGALQADAALPREGPARAEFLARMSHELRTPLHAILGFTKLLQRDMAGVLPAEQSRHLEHVRSAGDHLLSLVNAMLDLSWLEAGGMRLELCAVELGALARDVMGMLQPLAHERAVSVTIGPRLRGAVHADAMRLRQVLINLLSNAIKYNRPGGAVQIDARPDAAGTTLVVRDDGHGMTPLQLQNLFEPFNRLGRERSEVEGTGLGLALSKALVEHMGGRISVSSTPDSGSAFAVWLPRPLPGAAQPAAGACRLRR